MIPTDELDDFPRERSRLGRIGVYALVTLVAAAGIYLASRPAPQREDAPRLPAFELPLLKGGGDFGSEALAGAPVVVNFWASWCIPCREETPLLEQAWQQYEDEGLIVLGVNVQDQEEDALRFLREFDLSYPNVRDADQELARRLDVFGLPQTFFVRADGTLLGAAPSSGESASSVGGRVVLGAISREELHGNIRELLEDPIR